MGTENTKRNNIALAHNKNVTLVFSLLSKN